MKIATPPARSAKRKPAPLTTADYRLIKLASDSVGKAEAENVGAFRQAADNARATLARTAWPLIRALRAELKRRGIEPTAEALCAAAGFLTVFSPELIREVEKRSRIERRAADLP